MVSCFTHNAVLLPASCVQLSHLRHVYSLLLPSDNYQYYHQYYYHYYQFSHRRLIVG